MIVAILGLLAVFGREGMVSQLLLTLGLPRLHIYGLHGILLAHVFFNLPLATRLILQGWTDIPAERFRLSAQLGLTSLSLFKIIEWPMLRKTVPGAFLVIFVICLSSFAVALTLGGGPKATTVELAMILPPSVSRCWTPDSHGCSSSCVVQSSATAVHRLLQRTHRPYSFSS